MNLSDLDTAKGKMFKKDVAVSKKRMNLNITDKHKTF